RPGGGAVGTENGAVPGEVTKRDENVKRGNWTNQIESLHVPLLHHAGLLRHPPLLHGALLRAVRQPGLPRRLEDQPHVQRRGLRDDGGLHVHWHLLQCGDLPRLLLLLLLHDASAALDLLHQPLEHARLHWGAGRHQRLHRATPQPHPAPQPHTQAHQSQRGVLEVPATRALRQT
uniref:Uncharacterized protein n=1 Tax=Gopherus evgoodei TaxID=1825980 RepID=A0A8C4WEL5_9SAUR